jgi:monoamine oxidase
MYACRKVICAIPPSAVNLIEFLPSLPATLRSVVSGMSMGHMIKFAIVYKKPFWRDRELSGRVICLSGWQMVPRCEGLPVTATIQTSGPTKEPAILTGIIGKPRFSVSSPRKSLPIYCIRLAGRSALQWSQVEGDTLKQYILHSLSDILGSEAHATEHVEIAHWSEAMPGCGLSSGPTCAPRTGSMAYVHQLREPRGNLHFAGSETATRYTYTLDSLCIYVAK